MLKATEKITGTLEKLQIGLGCVTFLVFLTSAVFQVISRLIKVPMVWTEDMANYSFIWTVFMGAAVIFKRNQHFKFNVVEMKMKGVYHEYYDIAINAAILIFCANVCIYGIQVTQKFWNNKWNSIPSLKMGYTWLCVPLVGLTMSIYAIGHIVECLDHIQRKEYREFNLMESIEETEHVEVKGGEDK